MMEYLCCEWRHDGDTEPVLLYSELDENRCEQRKVEVFRDGRHGFADDSVSTGGTWLGKNAVPALEEINAEEEFSARPIGAAEFERIWKRALVRFPESYHKHFLSDLVSVYKIWIETTWRLTEPKTTSSTASVPGLWTRIVSLFDASGSPSGRPSASLQEESIPEAPVLRGQAHDIAMMMRLVTDSWQFPSLHRVIGERCRLWHICHVWNANWENKSLNIIDNAIEDPGDRFAVFALGTFDPDGYYREQCLARLEQLGPVTLPFVLNLVNNWVGVIAAAAADIARRLLQRASAAELLGAFAFLELISRGVRRDESVLRELRALAESQFLSRAEEITPEMLLAQERLTRRFAYGLAARHRFFDADGELLLLGRETDSMTRWLLARELLARDGDDSRLERRLLGDRSSQLRLLVMQNRYERNGGADWPEWENLLFDPAARVREYARFVLKKHGWNSFAEHYRNRLRGEPAPKLGAVAGLAETGDVSDLPYFESLLASSSAPAVRNAALTGLARLGGDKYADTLHKALFEDQLGKTAFRHIRRLRIAYSCPTLYHDFLRAKSITAKQRLLKLLCDANPWERLPWLVILYHELPDPKSWRLDRLLLEWEGGYTRATEAQRRFIKESLRDHDLPPHIGRHVEFALKNPNFVG